MAESELERRELRCFELLFLGCDPARPDVSLQRLDTLTSWSEALRPAWILTTSPAPLGPDLVALFARCCDRLAELRVGLAFEFFPWTPIATLAAAFELVRRAERENAGVLLDCWHFFMGPSTWHELESLPLEAIAYVQFTDSIPVAPGALLAECETSRRFPGEGHFELERFATALTEKGFSGTVSIEVLSEQTRVLGAEAFARRAVESSRRSWPEESLAP